MPDIFDSSIRKDEQETLDHQRKLLRGIRTKRYASRRTQKVPIDQSSLLNEATMTTPLDNLNSRPKHTRIVDDYSEVMRNERPSRNPFQAFAAKPIQTFFSSQHSDEVIIVVLRKHPLTQLKWLVTGVVLALVPFLFNNISLLSFLPDTYQFAGVILWYLLLTGFIMESFLTWFFNVYIITDERIIDVDFLSLIYRNISTAKIDNIEDVTATTGGAVRGIFDFGTVQIQTAAEKREFEFEDVPHPNRVTKLINELILEEEREKIEGRVN